jgi:hypothetical protein
MYIVHRDRKAVTMLTTIPALSPVLEIAFCTTDSEQLGHGISESPTEVTVFAYAQWPADWLQGDSPEA